MYQYESSGSFAIVQRDGDRLGPAARVTVCRWWLHCPHFSGFSDALMHGELMPGRNRLHRPLSDRDAIVRALDASDLDQYVSF